MSVSYYVREEFNVQSAIWAVAGSIARVVSLVGQVYRVSVKLAFLVYCTVTMLAVLLWQCKPSLSTLLVVGKALVLSSLCAVGMALAYMAPMVLVAVAVLVMYAEVTKPR